MTHSHSVPSSTSCCTARLGLVGGKGGRRSLALQLHPGGNVRSACTTRLSNTCFILPFLSRWTLTHPQPMGVTAAPQPCFPLGRAPKERRSTRDQTKEEGLGRHGGKGRSEVRQYIPTRRGTLKGGSGRVAGWESGRVAGWKGGRGLGWKGGRDKGGPADHIYTFTP